MSVGHEARRNSRERVETVPKRNFPFDPAVFPVSTTTFFRGTRISKESSRWPVLVRSRLTQIFLFARSARLPIMIKSPR